MYFIIQPDGEPLFGFMNNLLVYLTENNATFVSIGIYSVISLYLLYAVIIGNFKFGLRVFFYFDIHPMKYNIINFRKNETFMNSFLFNLNLILISSISITQFCVNSLKEYTSMTEIDLIFSNQIKYLKFFSYFYKYNIFEYSLFGISLLSALILLICSTDAKSFRSILAEKKKEKASLALNEEFSVNA